MWTATKRIIRGGFIGFLRNGFVSLASILVMTVTLFVIGSLLFLGAIFNASLQELKDKVDVNVYFVTTAPEDSILALKKDLEALPEVKGVTYTSREQALATFQERHKDDQLTIQALQELDNNPLGASLSIKAKETSQYEGIAKFLESGSALGKDGTPIIDKVNYFQNKSAIDKLSSIIDSANKVGLAVTLILIVASIIITFNTIRLAIYTSREEISVMRLVGASTMYVRGPFVFAGVLYGLIAALVTLLLFYPLALSLGPATERFFGSINIFSYYASNFAHLFLVITLSGVILGGVSSYLAVRKYLKV